MAGRILPSARKFKTLGAGGKKDIEELYTGSIRFITKMIAKSGETKQIETSRKMVVENGRVVRSDGIARDITSEFALRQQFQLRTDELEQQTRQFEQKTMELARANIEMLAIREELEKNRREQDSQFEELTKSREGLEAILNSSPSAIVMVNSYGKIATANGRVEDFLLNSCENYLNRGLIRSKSSK